MANTLSGFTLAQNAVNLASQASNALSGGAKGPTQNAFRYPLKALDNTTDYLSIKIFQYVLPAGGSQFSLSSLSIGGSNLNVNFQAPNFSQILSRSKISPDYYITLPIPQNITDSTSVTWGEDKIDPLSAAGVALGSEVISGGPAEAGKKAIEALKTLGANVDQNTISSLNTYIAAQAVSGLGANVSAQGLVTRATGQVLNSNLELLFQGVNLRSFPFTFEFAPRSEAEAYQVKQIIRTFKQSMSPKNGGAGSGTNTNAGLFVSSPKVFQLEYRSGNGPHPFLNVFKPCALSDMAVNYTGSNTYTTYADGTPVHITMSLTFKEINPVYFEDYDTGPGKQGVGY
jgi:hypothetical protein